MWARWSRRAMARASRWSRRFPRPSSGPSPTQPASSSARTRNERRWPRGHRRPAPSRRENWRHTMISPNDSEFHPRDPSNWRWTETTPLIFSVPEAGILANVYVAARPTLGVALSSIAVGQGFCRQPYEMDFTDSQMHLPCPESFTKYTLANGLGVEVTKPPTEYRFSYEYQLGDSCSFDLEFRALHEPFDATDPAHNPMLERKAGHAVDERLGDEWGNTSAGGEH